jgi:hypothetical protein
VFQVPDSQEFLNADTRQLTADAIALNNKVDAASEAKGSQAPVTVADLQGGKARLVVPTAGPASTASARSRPMTAACSCTARSSTTRRLRSSPKH